MEKLKLYVSPSPVFGDTESDQDLEYTLLNYTRDIEGTDLKRISNSFNSLSSDDVNWLKSVHAKLGLTKSLEQQIRDGVAVNQNFLNKLIRYIPSVTQQPAVLTPEHSQSKYLHRVRSLPWHVARQWGPLTERDDVYGPIVEALSRNVTRRGKKVLVPGTGCSRLWVEIAKLGYQVVGIECDSLLLLASALIFSASNKEIYEIQPFILETCNRMHALDNSTLLVIPDMVVDNETLSRITVYGNGLSDICKGFSIGEFDAIVTCLCLDTTIDTEGYIIEICRLLSPDGGIWINCGPLNYSLPPEAPRDLVLELSKEELLSLVQQKGLRIYEHKEIMTTFLSNPTSMMITKMGWIFFIATKNT